MTSNNLQPAIVEQPPVVRDVTKNKKERRRGGNDNKPGVRNNASEEKSGLVPSLRQAITSLQIVEQPESSFYVIDYVQIFTLFLSVAGFLVALPRKGLWKPPTYYAAYFLRALFVKLVAVGVATEQIVFAAPDVMSSNFKVPAVVGMLVDQFGVKVDVNGVRIAPLVTNGMLIYIGTHIRNLQEIAPAHPDLLASSNAANFGDYIFQFYGDVPQFNFVLGRVCAELELPFTASSGVANMQAAWTNAVMAHRVAAGGAPLAGAALVNLTTVNGLHDVITGAVPAFVPPGAALAAFVGEIGASLLHYGRVANPFAAAGLIPNLNTVRTLPTAAIPVFEVEQHVIGGLMGMREASTSPDGSFAPLVFATNLGNSTSGECVIRGLTAQEYVIGITLNCQNHLCDREGVPFNFTNVARRNVRYTTSGLLRTPMEMLSVTLRESLHAK